MDEDAWMLSRVDHDLLCDVREELWRWKKYCDKGSDLLGLGAAIAAVESVLDRELPTAYAHISLTHRPQFDGEGRAVTFEHGDLGFALSDIAFIEAGPNGSTDYHSSLPTYLTWDGSFERDNVIGWLEISREVRSTSVVEFCTDYILVPD